MSSKSKTSKRKIIFSLRVKLELQERGFDPILETDNINKPGFKCWIYNDTKAFSEALTAITKEGRA